MSKTRSVTPQPDAYTELVYLFQQGLVLRHNNDVKFSVDLGVIRILIRDIA